MITIDNIIEYKRIMQCYDNFVIIIIHSFEKNPPNNLTALYGMRMMNVDSEEFT